MNHYYEQRVRSAEHLGDRRLRVTFDDGFSAEIDLTALLDCGPIFERLHDPTYFARVNVDTSFGCLLWPGDLDLSSGSLRAWCEAGRFLTKEETDGWIAQSCDRAQKVA